MHRVIERSIQDNQWEELKAALRANRYNAPYESDEIKEILTHRAVPNEVRCLAYLNLISGADIATLQAWATPTILTFIDHSSTFSLHCEYEYFGSALMLAVLYDRIDVLRWLKRVINPAALGNSEQMMDLLTLAIENGSINTVDVLTTEFELRFDDLDDFIEPLQFCVASGNILMIKRMINELYGDDLRKKSTLKKIVNQMVRCSIQYNKPEVLKYFMKPKKEGGLGEQFKNEITSELAIMQNKLESQEKIFKGTKSIWRAVKADQLEMLQHLLKPEAEGGFGLVYQMNQFHHPYYDFSLNKIETINPTHWWFIKRLLDQCFQHHYDSFRCVLRDVTDDLVLLSIGLRSHCWDNGPVQEKNKEKYESFIHCLVMYVQEKLMNYRTSKQGEKTFDINIKLTIEMLEELSPGMGRMTYAKIKNEDTAFVEAFEAYASVHRDGMCAADLRDQAGGELVGLILNGYVVLNDNGEIAVEITEKRKEMTKGQRTAEGMTVEIMKRRALHAYEYALHDKSMKMLLNNYLIGEVYVENLNNKEVVFFPSDVMRTIMQYYQLKNPACLGEAVFIRSIERVTRVAETMYSAVGVENHKRKANEAELEEGERQTKVARTRSLCTGKNI